MGDFSHRRDKLAGRAMEQTRNFSPMPLGRRREPFDHPDWLFELKYDGFRALLSVGSQRPEFISRNANTLARFANLALFIDRELDASAVLDGEIVCFDCEGLVSTT
jgi:ATP-dependent DNA ligase